MNGGRPLNDGLISLGLLGFAQFCGAAPQAGMKADESARRTPIVLRAEGREVQGWLDDSATAGDFLKTLPRTISMKRWGKREFYGKTGVPLRVEGPTQSGFSDGDITYWVPGGSFAIFYDRRHNPDISDLVVFGKVSAGLESFSRFSDSIELGIEVVGVGPDGAGRP